MSVSLISRSLLQAQPKDACINSLLQKQHPSVSRIEECSARGSAGLTSFPELMLQRGVSGTKVSRADVFHFWGAQNAFCRVGKLHVTWCPMPSKIKIVTIK